MKRNKIFLIPFIFAFLLVGLSTAADTVEKDKGYISVNESLTKEIYPNQAEISISIQSTDKLLKKASEDNKIIANKVYSVLKALLGSNDYIKTGSYRATPQYIYTKENKRILDNYVVTNTVSVKTQNIQLVSNLIDKAIASGATNVDSLIFSSTDYENTCNDMLADITKKAYNQASSVAKSINSSITGIKSISTSCNTENAPRPMYGMMAKSSMDAFSSTPIESGKIKLYANVDASFYAK